MLFSNISSFPDSLLNSFSLLNAINYKVFLFEYYIICRINKFVEKSRIYFQKNAINVRIRKRISRSNSVANGKKNVVLKI